MTTESPLSVTRFFSILEGMGDTITSGPDLTSLFGTASGQHGYFTYAQARSSGVRDNLLAYHTETGKFIRVHRGVYRFRDYPSSPLEEVVAAWLAVGKEAATVSHESALALLELSDVIPNAIHLTVPRSKRNLPDLPGVKIHTTTRPLGPTDVTLREGIRITSATRTILDTAEAGTAPDQVELAIRQAIQRGLTTPRRLEKDARSRSRRVQDLVRIALLPVAS
ncbi:MAG TPA: type IV toxin-antitoxin system AbiEi family antitoxin domain-containing protein [Thermomicrobiales bacterium]